MSAQAFISEVQTINFRDPLDAWIVRDWDADKTIHCGLKNGKNFLFLCDNHDFYLGTIGAMPTNYFFEWPGQRRVVFDMGEG